MSALPEGLGAPVAGAFASALAIRHAAQLGLTRGRARGARSGWASTSLFFVSYVSAMSLAFAGIVRGAAPAAALAAGAGVWLAAVAFRIWALRHLAEQFSSLIEVRASHRLVETGPYALVRHPLHLAFGLEVTSFAVIAWWAPAAAPAALVWVVIAVRNRSEEAALRAGLGEAYDSYIARVPAMDPVRGLLRLLSRRRSR